MAGAASKRRVRGGGVEVAPELARIVGDPRLRAARRLGLAPAGPDVALPEVAVATALALATVSAERAAVVDALGRWDLAAEPAASLPERGAGLVELVSAPVSLPGLRLPALAATLDTWAARVGHLVVDLTGLDESGEHLEAIGVLDAVAVIALAGSTTLPQLARWMRELPPEKNLGVLLVGAWARR
jgi:hypothetical protein